MFLVHPNFIGLLKFRNRIKIKILFPHSPPNNKELYRFKQKKAKSDPNPQPAVLGHKG